MFSRTSAMAAVFAVVATSVLAFAATIAQHADGASAPSQVVVLERVEITGTRSVN